MRIPVLLGSQEAQITESAVLENVAGAVQQLTAILLIRVNLEFIPTVPICLHITKSFTFAKLTIYLSEYRSRDSTSRC